MSALERLAGATASCEACSESVREALEMHLVDTVGAWIASTWTAEGLALLQFRAAMSKAIAFSSPSVWHSACVPMTPAAGPDSSMCTQCCLACSAA